MTIKVIRFKDEEEFENAFFVERDKFKKVQSIVAKAKSRKEGMLISHEDFTHLMNFFLVRTNIETILKHKGKVMYEGQELTQSQKEKILEYVETMMVSK